MLLFDPKTSWTHRDKKNSQSCPWAPRNTKLRELGQKKVLFRFIIAILWSKKHKTRYEVYFFSSKFGPFWPRFWKKSIYTIKTFVYSHTWWLMGGFKLKWTYFGTLTTYKRKKPVQPAIRHTSSCFVDFLIRGRLVQTRLQAPRNFLIL